MRGPVWRRVRWSRVGLIGGLGTAAGLGLAARGEAQRRRALEERLGASQRELAAAEGRLRATEGQLAFSRLEVQGLRRLLARFEEQGISGGQVDPPPAPDIHTSIRSLAGDRVLVSAGALQGVLPGHPFSAYRGSQFLGKLVVEEVQGQTCTCRVLFMAEGQELRPGDPLATRLR